jgi:tetraacyldisaccharide 4'-kinase
MKLLRKIFLPFNLVYFLIVFTRNKLFDCSALKSMSFDFPVIGVGNLSIGGTGKTPMIEYLVRILVTEYKIAVLSRGYGRKSNGFVMSGDPVSSEIIGDEPYQIKNKFPEIIVAVNNDRKAGIDLLKKYNPNLDVVLLDDSFQHRKVKPGLSILLTCYRDLLRRYFVASW